MDGFAKALGEAGLKSKTGSSFDDAIKLLELGPVIMSTKDTCDGDKKCCPFTSGGHYVVLTGYENGMLIVNDPNKGNAGVTDKISLATVKKSCIINAGVIAAYK